MQFPDNDRAPDAAPLVESGPAPDGPPLPDRELTIPQRCYGHEGTLPDLLRRRRAITRAFE